MTPATLGPYTLLRRLGAGGMGEVWSAKRTALGGAARFFAVKTVLPEKAGSADARRQFLEEARVSMLMTHSNIVQVIDVDETPDGTCYMAMEYVDGTDLGKLNAVLQTRNELLSPTLIGYIIGEVLKALAYAHDHLVEGTRRTVIHRDISPQNVMLSITGEVKVMDFGIARVATEETSGTLIRGKLRYMPPDQFVRGIRAPTLDLFALGAILQELLDGRRFRGEDLEETELIRMCVLGIVPPLACPPERVPDILAQLRAGLLEPDAAKRIQSARDAHRLLTSWPGYRDARYELEELVQGIVGDSSLRMHIVPASDSAKREAIGEAAPPEPASTAPLFFAAPLLAAPLPVAPEPAAPLPASTAPLSFASPLPAAPKPTAPKPASTAPLSFAPLPAAPKPTPTLAPPADTDAMHRGPDQRAPDEDATGKRNREISITSVLASPVTPPEPAPTRKRPAALALLLACIGVMGFVGALGMALGWWSDEPAAPQVAEAEPPPTIDTPIAAPGTSSTSGTTSTSGTASTSGTEGGDTTSGDANSDSSSTSNTGSEMRSSPPPPPKSTVTIVATGTWVEVKIAGRVHTFDKLKGVREIKIKLKPGDYGVAKRLDPEEPWQSLGKVHIPEHAVTLEVGATAKIK